MVLINLSHSLPTVRQRATVKGVRMYSDRGKGTMTRVVGIVIALPYRGMEAVASVMSWVRAPCGGSLAAQAEWVRRPSLDGVGRVGLCVRGPEGSGESNLRPGPWGVGRVGTCVRGPEGSGESELASEALGGRASRNLRPRP